MYGSVQRYKLGVCILPYRILTDDSCKSLKISGGTNEGLFEK